MGQYWYRTAQATDVEATIEAPSLPAALLKLQALALTVTACGPVAPRRAFRSTLRLRTLLPSLYEQLANLLAEGVPLTEALRLLARDLSGDLRRPLLALIHEVEQGQSLSEAMAHQPAIFRPMIVAAVRAGEQAGDPASALRALGSQQQDLEDLVSKVALPLAYPLTVLTWFSLIVLFLTTFIAPKYLQLYSDLGMRDDSFPIPTRTLIFFSHVAPWAVALILVPLLCTALVYCVRRSVLRGNFDVQLLRLRLPLFGNLDILTGLARLSSSLALLLRQGVPTPQALLLAAETCDNPVMTLHVKRAAYKVSQGAPLGEALRGWSLWPESWLFRVASAEAEGYLPENLERLAHNYIEYAGSAARMWLLVAGPTIIVGLGLVVAWIGLALYAPLIAITSQLSS